jgi:hypothetical protein
MTNLPNRQVAIATYQTLISLHQALRDTIYLDVLAEEQDAIIAEFQHALEYAERHTDESWDYLLVREQRDPMKDPRIMMLDDEIIGPQLDITAPLHAVQIQIKHNSSVVWVNVDGVLRLRICRIPKLEIEDSRNEG